MSRLITPLRRSAAMVAPPKISRFIIRYITRFPGSEKLKPDGTGFRPAKCAFRLTGFGRGHDVAQLRLGECSRRRSSAWRLRADGRSWRSSARTSRTSISAASASPESSRLRNCSLVGLSCSALPVKSAGMRMTRAAVSRLVGVEQPHVLAGEFVEKNTAEKIGVGVFDEHRRRAIVGIGPGRARRSP